MSFPLSVSYHVTLIRHAEGDSWPFAKFVLKQGLNLDDAVLRAMFDRISQQMEPATLEDPPVHTQGCACFHRRWDVKHHVHVLLGELCLESGLELLKHTQKRLGTSCGL